MVCQVRAVEFLTKDYRTEYYFFEVVELLRRVVLTGWLILIPERISHVRLVVALLASLFVLVVTLMRSPYKAFHPVSRPTFPVSRPTFPVSRPTFPVSRPTFPVSRPTFPVSRPTFPVSRPTFPVPRPYEVSLRRPIPPRPIPPHPTR